VESGVQNEQPWEVLERIVESEDSVALHKYIDSLTAGETARAISRLNEGIRNDLFTLLEPGAAADIMEDIPDEQAADLIEDLSEEQAAAIVDEMESDHQADVLAAVADVNAEAILQEMDPEEAKDVRQLLSYPADSAGGVMITEYLNFPESWHADDLLYFLRQNAEEFADRDIPYAYIADDAGILKGVVKLRDLVFCPPSTELRTIMKSEPISIRSDSSLDDVKNKFEKFDYYGLPVIDKKDRLVGLIRRVDLTEALERRAEKTFMKASGIIGGEEYRTMPAGQRAVRRLSILTINIGLNILAASVIVSFQGTLEAVIALAVFLPMISDLSGCSGNQAVAVSIRELSLGLVKPHEVFLVLMKEMKVGMINGASLGLILGVVAYLWKGNLYLSMVVGGSLALTVFVSVCIGGILPLVLKRLRFDPAIASSPILTTITDVTGFFLVLSVATLMLSKLTSV